ncbi:conserved Plasmodium protein, unknown function [Plasmodium sp. DRC-Itaito]|nr:conserved Plasmodium protein, unknown function [Plasmodium sp. DRC-Itaito]
MIFSGVTKKYAVNNLRSNLCYVSFLKINRYNYSSIFDLISRKKKERINENSTIIIDDTGKEEEYNGKKKVLKGEVPILNNNNNINKKENVSYIIKSDLDKDNKFCDGYELINDDNIYNNKIYMLRYIKYLQINDDINKYRFISKHIINNVYKFKYNEILFILKIFCKRKYKNLLFLQCVSEYFYWLCKLKKSNKKNISYYLYYCSKFNYIPTIKYVDEYLETFVCYEKCVRGMNFFSLNMIEEETNDCTKDIKYIINVLYFLNICNLKKKKELFDTLLYMCIYNINDLTLKNTFLLLKIIINNIENDKYDISVFKTIHKNIERHINSLEDLDFQNYINIIFYNNIDPDETFFHFINNYLDKKDINISSNSMLSILKIMKKYNNKDHVMLKKMVHIMIDNFFNYTYDQILYVLKIFIQLNYFSQDFFNYLFKAFISSSDDNHIWNKLPAENWKDKKKIQGSIKENKYLSSDTYVASNNNNYMVNMYEDVLEGKKKIKEYEHIKYKHNNDNPCDKKVDSFDETYVGDHMNNKINIENDKTLQDDNHDYNNIFNFDDEKRDMRNNIFYNNILNEINNKDDNFIKDQNILLRNSWLDINIDEEKKEKKKKQKKINEISHLPLHLNIIKSKMKIDSSNIILNNIPMKNNNVYRKVTYDILYIQMHIYLFIYLGICGHRDMKSLDKLSKKIQHYLYMTYNKEHDISDDNIEEKRKRKQEKLKNESIKMISFSYAINKMKENYNNFFLLSQENKNIQLLHSDIKSIQMINKEENKKLLKEKKKIQNEENHINTFNDNIKTNKNKKEKYISYTCQDDQKNIFIKKLKKSCLHFVYNKNEKLHIQKLEKKKKNNNKLKEEKNDNMNTMKYMNVDNFRRSKLINKNKMKDNVYKNVSDLKKRNKENMEQKKKILKVYQNDHPAFIRLHNRKLFRRYFNGMYRSQLYLDKIKTKKRQKENGMNKKKRKRDLRLRTYRKMKTLRNTILKRYGYIFKKNCNVVSSYINDYVYNEKEKNTCFKEDTYVDMILKKNEIHIDDCLFINYNSLYNVSKKNRLKKKYCNFISRSNELTYEEYIIQNDNYNMKKEYYKNDIIKWIYRYINNCNVFLKYNNKKGQLINEYDIKRLDICIRECNSYMKEEEEKKKKKKKLLISLKNISLICEACTNLYYYNNNLYDILLYNILKILDNFYNDSVIYMKQILICNENKSNRNMSKDYMKNDTNFYSYLYLSVIHDKCEENNILHNRTNKHNNIIINNNNVIKCRRLYIYLFENTWRVLICYMQVNHFIKNILENDIRYNTFETLIDIYTHKYFYDNIKNIIYIINYIKSSNILYINNIKYSFVYIFFINYFNISVIVESLFLFNKIIYMMSQMSYPKNIDHIKKKFNIILYNISNLYYIYIKTLLDSKNKVEIKNGKISTDNIIKHIYSNKDMHNLFSCVNFYILFLYILKNINEQKNYFINTTISGSIENNDMMITRDDLKIKNRTHRQNNLYVHTNNILTYDKTEQVKNDDDNNIIDNRYIFKIMLHYINLLRYSNILNNKSSNNNEGNETNIYIFTVIRFYYIFKTFYRNNKLLYYMNEKNYQDFFPLFIIKILNKKKIKEIYIPQLFSINKCVASYNKQEFIHGIITKHFAPFFFNKS